MLVKIFNGILHQSARRFACAQGMGNIPWVITSPPYENRREESEVRPPGRNRFKGSRRLAGKSFEQGFARLFKGRGVSPWCASRVSAI
jgi:hypothetical protein